MSAAARQQPDDLEELRLRLLRLSADERAGLLYGLAQEERQVRLDRRDNLVRELARLVQPNRDSVRARAIAVAEILAHRARYSCQPVADGRASVAREILELNGDQTMSQGQIRKILNGLRA